MEFLMAVRTLIATTVMLFCSLWLARQLKIHRPRLPVSAVLILSLIMLFEPVSYTHLTLPTKLEV